jgi:hypothetical protein
MYESNIIESNSRAFVAVAESYGTVSRFLQGVTDRDFYLSYAKEFPDLSEYDQSCFWMSGGYAARMQRAGIAPHLVAPGQDWISTIDESLTHRKITTGTIADLRSLSNNSTDSMSPHTELFLKPAEAKIDSIPASIYTVEKVLEIFNNEDIPSETLFQWTETILPLNYEHRFFVANGEVRAGSPYLIDRVVYHSEMISPCYLEALDAAENFLKLLKDNQPPAFTLDVALREDTKEWLIVEVNPAWSSGPYGAEPAEILNVLDVACNSGSDMINEKWLWRPAEYLVKRALEASLMKIVDPEYSSGVFKAS